MYENSSAEWLKHWRETGRELLAAEMSPATINESERTINVIWFTGAEVPRTDWWTGERYILRFDPKGADLSRLNNGAPVLDHHGTLEGSASQKGVVDKAWIENGKYLATLRYSRRPEVDGLWGDIKDKIVTKFSMGVELLETTETRNNKGKLEFKTVTKWRPFEISTEPIPADFGTTTLTAAHAAERENHMEKTETTGGNVATINNPDAEQIRKVASVCNLAAFGEDLIGRGTGINEARAALINKMTEQSSGEIRHVHADVTRHHRDGLAVRMAEALSCRYTGQEPSDGAREYMTASVSDMARICCQSAGVQVSGFGAERYIRLAMHSTSDFPFLTEEAGRRMLLSAYETARPAIQKVARRSTAADFRTKSALRLGGAPKLVKVLESGEVTSGSRGESKETYRVYTFGRIFAITREALVNDDLGAFADFARAYGIAAANLEAQELVDLLYGTAGYGPAMGDLTALIDATHSNLAGSPGVISGTTFSAARLALRTATDVDGETIIETVPRFLLVPAALETVAETYLAALYPAQASNVNPFSGKFELLVEPRLDAKSATAWWIFGDPQMAPVLEYSYLNDVGGPQVDSRPGFEVLGMEFRCVLDYGVGAVGWRGVFKGNN